MHVKGADGEPEAVYAKPINESDENTNIKMVEDTGSEKTAL